MPDFYQPLLSWSGGDLAFGHLGSLASICGLFGLARHLCCLVPKNQGLRKDTQCRGDPVLFETKPWKTHTHTLLGPQNGKMPYFFFWREWFLVILFHPNSLWVHQESPRFLLVTSVGLYGSIFCLKFFNPLKRQMLFPSGFWNGFCLGSLKPWGQPVQSGSGYELFQWQVLFSY